LLVYDTKRGRTAVLYPPYNFEVCVDQPTSCTGRPNERGLFHIWADCRRRHVNPCLVWVAPAGGLSHVRLGSTCPRVETPPTRDKPQSRFPHIQPGSTRPRVNPPRHGKNRKAGFPMSDPGQPAGRLTRPDPGQLTKPGSSRAESVSPRFSALAKMEIA
jgi:hypothetical protein